MMKLKEVLVAVIAVACGLIYGAHKKAYELGVEDASLHFNEVYCGVQKGTHQSYTSCVDNREFIEYINMLQQARINTDRVGKHNIYGGSF